MDLLYLHVMAAILATYRITELFAMDKVTERLRKKFNGNLGYLWNCHRCLSVWVAFATTLLLLLFPWANWPFALAFLYLRHIDFVVMRRRTNSPELLVQKTNTGFFVKHNDFDQPTLDQLAIALATKNQRPNAPIV